MRCHEIEDHLMRYVDGRLDAERKGQIDTHLEVCPRCRKTYEDEVELVAAFHAGGLRPAEPPFVEAVMRDVGELEAARDRGRRVPLGLGPGGRWALAAAAAATLLVGWRAAWIAERLGARSGGRGLALPEALTSTAQWVHALALSIETTTEELSGLWHGSVAALGAASQEHFALFGAITIAAAMACIALIGGFCHKPIQENRR